MANYWLEPSQNITAAGWTSQSNDRGTFDIIWSCVQTASLCAWVSICVNIPAPSHGRSDLLLDKFYFVLLTLLGPELVFLLAYAQYQSAQESVQLFHDLGKHDWTLMHSFFADMGGIHVRPPSWKHFPVNSKQLHYLVSRGHMEYPRIPLWSIKEKSKTDVLAKVITIAQTLYFLIDLFARIEQALAISTLELTVVGFIFCSLATSFCWWSKPVDIEHAYLYDMQTPIDKVVWDAGEKAKYKYRQTPLDFAAPEEWNGYNLWIYYVNILRQMGLFPERHQTRPIQKFGSLNFPRPRSRFAQLITLCLAVCYVSIFFGAWHFYFPTNLESLLWRVVTIAQLCIVVAAGSFEIYYFETPEKPHKALSKVLSGCSNIETEEASPREQASAQSAFSRLWNKPCNNTIGRHPVLNVPLRSLLMTTPLCAGYVLCRWYLLAEDILSLRSLPPSSFQQADWTRYWPAF